MDKNRDLANILIERFGGIGDISQWPSDQISEDRLHVDLREETEQHRDHQNNEEDSRFHPEIVQRGRNALRYLSESFFGRFRKRSRQREAIR